MANFGLFLPKSASLSTMGNFSHRWLICRVIFWWRIFWDRRALIGLLTFFIFSFWYWTGGGVVFIRNHPVFGILNDERHMLKEHAMMKTLHMISNNLSSIGYQCLSRSWKSSVKQSAKRLGKLTFGSLPPLLTSFLVFMAMGSEMHWRQTSAHMLPSEKVVSEPQVRNFTFKWQLTLFLGSWGKARRRRAVLPSGWTASARPSTSFKLLDKVYWNCL